MTIDLDSRVCEVHGHPTQGAASGHTHTLGYHPLVATRAESGEVLHARQRTGRANPPPERPGASTSWPPGSAAPAPAGS